MSDNQTTSPTRRQSLFSALGWLGFLFLIPLFLKSVGLNAPADFLAQNLGLYGSAAFLLIYFYLFPLLDLVFGADRHFLPLLLGFIVSFLFFAIVIPIPFMDWYSALFGPLSLVKSSLVFLSLAVLSMILGILLSYIKRGIGIIGQLIIILGLPLAACISAILLHAETVLNLPLFKL